MGWHVELVTDPGAHAPGFMLAPASQAEPAFGTEINLARDEWRESCAAASGWSRVDWAKTVGPPALGDPTSSPEDNK